MKKPVALITGTSSGIGLSAAIALAKHGYSVVATMRDVSKRAKLVEEARLAGVEPFVETLRLDVTDPESIERVVSTVLDKYGRIDLLVNNAGFAQGGFAEEVPMEDWRRQFETNVFGVVAMAKAVIPAMRERGKGTIVNIGSVSGRIGFPGYGPYAASKFAVEGFSESLRLELLPFGVHVVLVEPGAYKTDIWDKGFRQMRTTASSPYARLLDRVLAYSRRTAESAPDPRETADLIVRIASTPHPDFRYPIGKGARLALLAKSSLPWRWWERLVNRMISRP